MILKRFLLCALTSFTFLNASFSFAGGVEEPTPPSFAGIYLEGNVGYAFRDWSDVVGTPFDVSFGGNARGGFASILDLGYQFNQFVSIELGWIHLPTSHGSTLIITPSDLLGSDFSIRIPSWAAYLAGKLTIPVYENTYLFGKLGAAYVKNVTNIPILPTQPDNFSLGSDAGYWTPLFAFGIQYYFNANVLINFQYTRLPGYNHLSTNRFAVPASDIFTLGAAYKFLT